MKRTATISWHRHLAGAVFLCLAAGLLGGCAETSLFAHTAKNISSYGSTSERGSGGGYKVGNPYQIDGVWYTPREDFSYVEEGMASWYGPNFHGKYTANGETYDMEALTAAHRTLPMPCLVRVTNLENGRSAILRINDRGPFARGRILDGSRRAAEVLGYLDKGSARVRVEIMAEESRVLRDRLLAAAGESPMGVAGSAPGRSYEATDLAPIPAAEAREPAPVRQTATAPEPVRRPQPAPAARPAAAAVSGPGQYVQVGAFADPGNADRLKGRVSAFGRVEVKPTAGPDGRTLYRVRIGPVSGDAANSLLADVRAGGYPAARLVAP